MYPNSDSTNSDIKKVLFPVGVTSFNEDFQTSENFREQEEIARFNSIVKTPGIASRKRSMNNNYLFPSPITGNQISITSGTGYTPNGARIELPATISITNITTLPGYQAPASNNRVYLVLRKVLQEYQNRSHPITGDQKTTRQRLKTDNTIVEFIVTGLPLSQLDAPDLVTDKDVLIIGRLSSISPVTFDTTEKTGGRIALVLSESSGPTTIRTFTDTFYMDTQSTGSSSTNRTVTFTAVANLGEAVTVQSVATPTVIVGAPNVTPVLHQIDVILLR